MYTCVKISSHISWNIIIAFHYKNVNMSIPRNILTLVNTLKTFILCHFHNCKHIGLRYLSRALTMRGWMTKIHQNLSSLDCQGKSMAFWPHEKCKEWWRACIMMYFLEILTSPLSCPLGFCLPHLFSLCLLIFVMSGSLLLLSRQSLLLVPFSRHDTSSWN